MPDFRVFTVKASPGGSKTREVSPWKNPQALALVTASALFLALLFAGLEGRRYAKLRAQLNDLAAIRQQLHLAMEAEKRVLEPSLGDLRPTATGEVQTVRAKVGASADYLRSALRQFDLTGIGKLPPLETQEMQLNRAVLANADRRFAEATNFLTGIPAETPLTQTEKDAISSASILGTRADACFGLRDWTAALPQYLQLLALNSNNVTVMARVAACRQALGHTNESLQTFVGLADTYRRLGDRALLFERPQLAADYYRGAIELAGWLGRATQPGSNTFLFQQAKDYHRRGQAWLLAGKTDVAIADFLSAGQGVTHLLQGASALPDPEVATMRARILLDVGDGLLAFGKLPQAVESLNQAITNLTGLIETQDLKNLEGALAIAYQKRGSAFLAEGQMDGAARDFDQAVDRFAQLAKKPPATEWTTEWSRSLNNRGVTYRAAGKLDAAIADFDQALRVLSEATTDDGSHGPALHPQVHSIATPRTGPIEVKQDVTMVYTGNALEAFVRTRLSDQRRAGERPVLALGLKNRGYAWLAQGKFSEATQDFQRATDVLSIFVYQDGERDLTFQLAKTLSALAWVKATSADAGLRNGREAQKLATEACELTDSKLFIAFDALAAAQAEQGNFSDAIQWQQKALELAATKFKPELGRRLETYKNGTPFRAPLGQTNSASAIW